MQIDVPQDHPLRGMVPIRLPVWWGWRGPVGRTHDDAAHSGRCVVLRIEKKFSRLERLLARWLRAPKEVLRPLDDMNSLVWELCDGQHGFQSIVEAMDATFHEEAAPVVERVTLAIDMFQSLGLLLVRQVGAPVVWTTDPGVVPEGQNLPPRHPDLDLAHSGQG